MHLFTSTFDCPICWGRGEVTREDQKTNGRLYAWPCPRECPSASVSFIKLSSGGGKPKAKRPDRSPEERERARLKEERNRRRNAKRSK